MTIRRYLLLAVTALGLSACNAPHKLGSSSGSPSSPARYNYNAATQSYEWQQGDRQVTGSYQP